jgi:hypothetical protein
MVQRANIISTDKKVVYFIRSGTASRENQFPLEQSLDSTHYCIVVFISLLYAIPSLFKLPRRQAQVTQVQFSISQVGLQWSQIVYACWFCGHRLLQE